ncbi:ABC transporter permease [Heyndrickxia sporothermodurans]|nr:ABC transporter permease [Heyndrickxia sporothermodurans]
MNIFNIAMKEIKQDFRDIRTLVFMLAFPLVLMLVLGTALSNAFTDSIKIDDIKVLYLNTGKGDISQYFNKFIETAGKSGITFTKEKSNMDGKNEVKQGNYDGFLEVNQTGVQLYLNDQNSISGNILQGTLTAFVDKYNIASAADKIAPEKVLTVFSSEHKTDFIKETSVLPNKQPGAMDYYAIAMTTMIALYGAISASSLINSERVRKTGDRLIIAPIRKSEIFIGKVLGCIVINTVCIALVIACSKIFFKAYWGDHLGMVFLVLLTEILFAVSFGISLSYISKSSTGPRMIVMLVVQLASFFGGAYFKIENPEGIFKLITKLSPLTWENSAITKIIYSSDLSAAIPAITINLSIAIIFLFVAVISLQRREGL